MLRNDRLSVQNFRLEHIPLRINTTEYAIIYIPYIRRLWLEMYFIDMFFGSSTSIFSVIMISACLYFTLTYFEHLKRDEERLILWWTVKT